MDEIIEQHIYNRFLFLSMFKKGFIRDNIDLHSDSDEFMMKYIVDIVNFCKTHVYPKKYIGNLLQQLSELRFSSNSEMRELINDAICEINEALVTSEFYRGKVILLLEEFLADIHSSKKIGLVCRIKSEHIIWYTIDELEIITNSEDKRNRKKYSMITKTLQRIYGFCNTKEEQSEMLVLIRGFVTKLSRIKHYNGYTEYKLATLNRIRERKRINEDTIVSVIDELVLTIENEYQILSTHIEEDFEVSENDVASRFSEDDNYYTALKYLLNMDPTIFECPMFRKNVKYILSLNGRKDIGNLLGNILYKQII